MKPNWGNFLQKTTRNPATKRLCGENVELVSDELALEVRGGDKDYSPAYEHEAVRKDILTNPSILLKL